MKNIRNFCIIAHIDHGKSTLADRLLEDTGTLVLKRNQEQVLDKMDLERERGITIKAHPVRMSYQMDGIEYQLNLIDTPGHVDFNYEVSRSLSSCEGALLLIDAVQGIQAQTLSNFYQALENNLVIIPVINKIDLPSADIKQQKASIQETLGFSEEEIILTSAKEGFGVERILQNVISRIPPPKGSISRPLRALVFDSNYDVYRGVVVHLRVFDGQVKEGDKIKFLASGKTYDVCEVGIFKPEMARCQTLQAGETGYLLATIKDIRNTRVGDTIAHLDTEVDPLPGYRKVLPMVFVGLYPSESTDYNLLRDALDKLKLNDAAFSFEPETSPALGFGFRCGFLGLLHMEIIQERLEREHKLRLIMTAPSVVYEIKKTNGEVIRVDNPLKMPSPQEIEEIREPIVKATIVTPQEYVGTILDLLNKRRGIHLNMEYLTAGTRVILTYRLPLTEIIGGFFDTLKSCSRGFASLDYEWQNFQAADLVKVDLLLNSDVIDAFSSIVHREQAYYHGRALVEKLKKLIPRQMFEIRLQAAIGGRVIAKEIITALRKNVLAKCYGGDITRKRKLLEKQKEGKKRLKQIGHVNIPQEAFMAVLKVKG